MSPQLGISCFAVTPLLFFPPFPHVTFFLFPDSTRRQKKTALFISLPRREKPLTDSVLQPASSPGLLQAIKTKQVCLRQRVQGEAADSPEDLAGLCAARPDAGEPKACSAPLLTYLPGCQRQGAKPTSDLGCWKHRAATNSHGLE